MFYVNCSELMIELDLKGEDLLEAIKEVVYITGGELFWEPTRVWAEIPVNLDDLVVVNGRVCPKNQQSDGYLIISIDEYPIYITEESGGCKIMISDSDVKLFPYLYKLSKYFDEEVQIYDGGQLTFYNDWLRGIGLDDTY